jgi:formamidopyrimidine-DNA glycosylase
MPELPEVETVVRGLRASLPGRQIVGVRLGKSDFIDDPVFLGEHLPGNRVASVSRCGKFIAVQMELRAPDANPEARLHLVIHLGMTGRLTTHKPSEPPLPHTHVFFSLDDGNELRYTDTRRFGRMLLATEAWMQELRVRWGRDPLEIGAAEFVQLVGSRGSRIKALLLDQHILSGVGNIYADESLWRARIHPARRADRLTAQQLRALHRAIQTTLRAAIDLKGSSFSDYVDSEGQPGSFQSMHRVYQREGKPCRRCGRVIRRIQVAGRSSHFCPGCQPAPRASKKRPRAKAARLPGKKSGSAKASVSRGAVSLARGTQQR